jgi:hypothetical protein
MDLTVSIVNYNTKEFLLNCLQSLYEGTDEISFEVFIIDNNSIDDTIEMTKEKFPQIKLICNSTNVGFSKANNQAIQQGSGRYILLLNPDTKVLKGTLEKMVVFLDGNPQVGVLGCKILNPDGSLQISTFGFPSLIKEFFNITSLGNLVPPNAFFRKLLGKHLSKIFKNTLTRYWDHDQSRDVDYVMGACFMIRRNAIDQVGLLDENFFMYVEDAEWCFRFKKSGWQIRYEPNMSVIHYANRTCSADLDLNSKLFIEYYKGILYFFQKHHQKIKQFILRGMLVGICSLRIMIERFKEILLTGENEKIKDNLIKYTAVRRLAIISH